MALSQRLEFRQSQALVMTPQLMQAIKLLQLSNLDLAPMSRANSSATRCSSAPATTTTPPAPLRPKPGAVAPATAMRMRGQPADRIGEDLETSRSRSKRGSAPTRQRVPRRRRRENRRRRRRRRRPIRNGRAPARGGEDGGYNLEAFVSAETTLADHLAEQLALAVSDPAAPHDRPIPDQHGRRGRLSGRRSRHRRRKARRAARRGRGRACHPADARSARRLRPQSHRMPRHPAQGTRPLRSGDARAGRPSRSPGQARSRRACAACAASTTTISPT